VQHQSSERIQQTDKKNKEDFQIYDISTLLNGKIENKSMNIEVSYKNSGIKKTYRQHKVTLIGDSFLRGIRENVELSLSNKCGIYSMLKPGCKLNTLLESANRTSRSLTHKDVILICGGANDFNSDKDEPTTDHIMEFIKLNNHTNTVLANMPIRYDLSHLLTYSMEQSPS
jgi:hypothetical protein